jgi:hypothetical protein
VQVENRIDFSQLVQRGFALVPLRGIDVSWEARIGSSDEIFTDLVSSLHYETVHFGCCNSNSSLDGAGCDITAVYCVRVEVYDWDHQVASSEKACLLCAIVLNAEQLHHGYQVLASVGGVL